MFETEFVEAPQEVWVVRTDFLEDNKDAVCGYIEGRIESNLYAGAGDEYIDNREAVIELVKEAQDIEPSDAEIEDWSGEIGTQIAIEGGATRGVVRVLERGHDRERERAGGLRLA